jgi:hypothetical protein
MSPPRYRIVVEGELGPRYAAAFDGMTVRADGGETELIGPITDSSHRYGLLERIASLGLRLHSLAPLEAENAKSGGQTRTQPAVVNHTDPGTDSKGP